MKNKKNYMGFLKHKIGIANFEAFCRVISSSKNILFLKSAIAMYFCCNSSAAFVVTETDSIHSTCTKNYDLPAKTTQQTIYYLLLAKQQPNQQNTQNFSTGCQLKNIQIKVIIIFVFYFVLFFQLSCIFKKKLTLDGASVCLIHLISLNRGKTYK